MTLFGPVFYFDLVRQTRRRLPSLLRLVYLAGLYLVLLLARWIWAQNSPGGELPEGQLVRFIESFFSTFIVVQFLFVCALVPALTAGSITEEKEGQTLPFLLASSLRNHEIILGKLASRLVSVLLIVIAGLPVFSLLQLLGGVDPAWLLAGFVVTGSTLLSLASVSIFWSTILRRSREAVLFSYLSLPAYTLLFWLLIGWARNSSFPSTSTWTSPITLGDVVQAFGAGEPLWAFVRGQRSLYGGGADTLEEVVQGYVLSHAIVTLLCLLAAPLQIRKAALKEASIAQREPIVLFRPPMGDHPVLWRELHATRGRVHWLARLFVIGIVLLSFWPLLSFLGSGRYASFWMNGWVRTVGTMVACLLLLAVAVRAAASMTSERQSQTYDVLLTTLLSLDEILSGKWLGAVGSVRLGWLWLGTIVGLGLLSGGVAFFALPLLALCWAVQGSFMASLGLFYSLRCRTTLRAMVATIATVVGLWIAPLILLSCCAFSLLNHGDLYEKMLGMISPPAAMAIVPVHMEEFGGYRGVESTIFFVIVGQVGWAVFSAILWNAARHRFRVMTGRMTEERGHFRPRE